jgi:large subunit ribosomal protein L24
MSQLAVRPGRNAARTAKKLKEIRHVKGAIAWHEKERAKRQKIMQERWESKQSVIQRVKWENQHIKKVREDALSRVKEDWSLGALRPNRAVGAAAKKYGALGEEQLQKPDIPLHTQRNRNKFRESRGLPQEYPLVIDDKKYFHIERDDRVIVVNGRDKGKIGLVQNIVPRTHEILVKGVNMVRRGILNLPSMADCP